MKSILTRVVRPGLGIDLDSDEVNRQLVRLVIPSTVHREERLDAPN